MTSTMLSQSDLATLVTDLVAAGTTVIAPVLPDPYSERTEYRPIRALDDATLGGSLPRRSLRELFRPSRDLPFPPASTAQLVLGARPCDAAALASLESVKVRDDRDARWRDFRRATTVVTLACPGVDGSCFCSGMGIGPDSTHGADVLLVPAAGPTPWQARVADLLRRSVDVFLSDTEPFSGAAQLHDGVDTSRTQLAIGYLAEPVTPRGDALLRGRGRPFTEPAELRKAEAFVSRSRDKVAINVANLLRIPKDGETVLGSEPSATLSCLPKWLSENADHKLLRALTFRCLGCGSCTAVCSTFDHLGDGAADVAAKPREAGLRQRVIQNFCAFPRSFHALPCTGCGRCARVCEAGMSLPEVLGQLGQLARADAAAAR